MPPAIPRKQHEQTWCSIVSSGKAKLLHNELRAKRTMSLEDKIALSSDIIACWYEAWSGEVAVSFSGGKDSAVLLWLVRSIYPDVPAVFCNTGLEYPEIVTFVKSHPNITIMHPKIPFQKVIETHGFPMISKRVARGISVLRHPTERNQNIYGLYDRGVNRFGEPVTGFKIAQRWRFLVDAPFEVSEKCCDIMKKEPMHRYAKQSGRVQFVGTLAEDSRDRERTYLQHGCNAYDLKTPRSTPLGFWTEQDILECIHRYQIPYSPVYGEIWKTKHGWECTGVRRTGCVYCGFGLQMETGPENRFQRLHRSHPHHWDFCINRLGIGDVLEYIRDRVPTSMRNRFDPNPQPQQMRF